MYAESMELFSRIIELATELAKLAQMLVADGMRFIVWMANSKLSLEFEHLASLAPGGNLLYSVLS